MLCNTFKRYSIQHICKNHILQQSVIINKLYKTQQRTVYHAIHDDDKHKNNDVFTVPNTLFRTIMINKPDTQHMLSYDILDRIYTYLNTFDSHSDITGMLLTSQDYGNRIFTSGTDYIALYNDGLVAKQSIQNNIQPSNTLQYDYINLCYKIAYMTSNMRKPYICSMDGYTSGSGFALSANTRYRIATQNTVLNINENQYGLIPHYGLTYMLSRMNGSIGSLVGLTGLQLYGADVFHSGFATQYCSSGAVEQIARSFDDKSYPHRFQGELAVDTAMMQYADLPRYNYLQHLDWIDELFYNSNTVEDIINHLQQLVHKHASDHSLVSIAQTALNNIYRSSPLSLKLTLACLQVAPTLSYEECLQLEYRVISQLYQHNDFYSAVQHKLIDNKQGVPQWQYKELSDVNDKYVEKLMSEFIDVNDELQLNRPDHELRWVVGQNPFEYDGKIYTKFNKGIPDKDSILTVDNVHITQDDLDKMFDPVNPLVKDHFLRDKDYGLLAQSFGLSAIEVKKAVEKQKQQRQHKAKP